MGIVAFIPNLSSDSTNIKEPEGIIRYVLRHYLMTPKNINDTFRDMEISFMYDVSLATDEVQLSQIAEESLTSVFVRYFPTGRTIVTASPVDNTDGSMALQISVSLVLDDETYSVSAAVTVNRDGTVDFNL